jgi:hypothetical protein
MRTPSAPARGCLPLEYGKKPLLKRGENIMGCSVMLVYKMVSGIRNAPPKNEVFRNVKVFVSLFSKSE